VPMKTPK